MPIVNKIAEVQEGDEGGGGKLNFQNFLEKHI